MQPVRVSALAAAIALLMGTLATSSAPAVGASQLSRYVHDDPAGDMVQFSGDPGGENGDFLRSVVSHRRHAVVIRSSFTDLVQADTQYTEVNLFTDEHRLVDRVNAWRRVTFGWYAAGEPTVFIWDIDLVGSIACDGLSGDVDFEENTLRIRVPRRCLERPRWIRAGLESSVSKPWPADSWWGDSGFGPGAGEQWNLSPRLYREPELPIS